MFGVKTGKCDCLRIKKLDFPRGRDSWCLPKAAKGAHPLGTTMETSQSSRVSRMKLSFLIIQGIFLCSVRSYNNNSPRISKLLLNFYPYMVTGRQRVTSKELCCVTPYPGSLFSAAEEREKGTTTTTKIFTSKCVEMGRIPAAPF